MDLHVRSVSPSSRTVTPGRSQPIRLQSVRPAAPVAPAQVEAPVFQPINRATSGPFAYEQGSFVLAGQTEVDGDGRPQVRGTARFQQGKVSLESQGRFVLGYEGQETALIGDGDFVWRDGRGVPLTGKGTIAVRQDPYGNAIVELDGTIATRHQTIAIEGPAQAEIDVRENGAFVVRLKGKARFGTPLATIDGDLDLTYGEVDGERLNAVIIHGRAQGQNEAFQTDGDGELARRWANGRSTTVLTISGPGTYRHGQLTCEGQIVLRIVPHGAAEAYDGRVLGRGRFEDQGLTAAGLVEGAFFQFGERHDFDGRLEGQVALQAGPARAESAGTVDLALRREQTVWQAVPAGQTTWTGPGLQAALPQAHWQRRADGGTLVSGTGRLATAQAPWWLHLDGAVGLNDGPEGWSVSAAGELGGALAGGIALTGPAKLTLDGTLCQVTCRAAAGGSLAGATVAAGVPVSLEAGPLPDGRGFWHARLGGPLRPVTVSAAGLGADVVVRIRQDGPERPVDERCALAALELPPQPADEQAEGDADPDRPEPEQQP